jgi:dCMP deaminase
MKKAIILYLPVVHKGYLKLLETEGSSRTPLYILSESILDSLISFNPSTMQSVSRDLRALSPIDAAGSMIFLYKGQSHLLEETEVNELFAYDQLVFVEDEISHLFIKKYAISFEKIKFVSWFLRWDMPTSTTQVDVECDRAISIQELKELGYFKYLRLAKEEAAQSPDWWRQVGSVLVRDNRVVLSTHNTHLPVTNEVYYAGDPRSNFNAGQSIEISKAIHAEASIIAQASKHGCSVKGCELFVTTFPCPACANLIALSGIKRVYFVDGYSLVGAIDVLRAYGVEVVRVV